MKKRPKVTDTEKISIAYSVLVEKEFQTDIAKGYRLSNSRVNAIVKKVSQNRNYINEMKEKY